MNELMDLKKRACFLKVPGGVDTKIGKVNILLQAYLSNWRLESFSLISDSMFLVQVNIYLVLVKHDLLMVFILSLLILHTEHCAYGQRVI